MSLSPGILIMTSILKFDFDGFFADFLLSFMVVHTSPGTLRYFAFFMINLFTSARIETK